MTGPAPSVDISNQDTIKGVLDENMIETMASSIAMVETAEHALKTGKVKLMPKTRTRMT